MAAMPLLECFVRGDVDPEVSLLAAQGALAPRADEQLAILVYLVTNDETHVATVANQTIAALPVEAVAGLLARQDTSEKVLAFFAPAASCPGAVATEDIDAPLVDTGEEVAAEAEPAKVTHAAGDDGAAAPQAGDEGHARAARRAGPRPEPDDRGRGAEQPQARPDRGRGVRAHGQRLGGRAADNLDEPRRGCGELAVAAALVKNPKTPAAISLHLLPRMTQRDVKQLAIDRNVPESLRLNAQEDDAAAAGPAEVARRRGVDYR